MSKTKQKLRSSEWERDEMKLIYDLPSNFNSENRYLTTIQNFHCEMIRFRVVAVASKREKEMKSERWNDPGLTLLKKSNSLNSEA